ncbi:MAG: hypothetical protein ACREP7_01260 [Lysobacter sp.]
MNVLLHGIASVDARAQLGVDEIPAPADLAFQIALQRAQVFVEPFRIVTVTELEAFALPLVFRIDRMRRARGMVSSAPRSFDDHFVHIVPHKFWLSDSYRRAPVRDRAR